MFVVASIDIAAVPARQMAVAGDVVGSATSIGPEGSSGDAGFDVSTCVGIAAVRRSDGTGVDGSFCGQ